MMDKAFIDLVASMRDAQKKYYQLVVSKDAFMKRKEISEALGLCKRLESQVDRWISEYKWWLLVDLVQANNVEEKKELVDLVQANNVEEKKEGDA